MCYPSELLWTHATQERGNCEHLMLTLIIVKRSIFGLGLQSDQLIPSHHDPCLDHCHSWLMSTFPSCSLSSGPHAADRMKFQKSKDITPWLRSSRVCVSYLEPSPSSCFHPQGLARLGPCLLSKPLFQACFPSLRLSQPLLLVLRYAQLAATSGPLECSFLQLF